LLGLNDKGGDIKMDDKHHLETIEGIAKDLFCKDERCDLLLAASRFDELTKERQELAGAIHYPDCWDTAAYPTLVSALQEIGCSEHQ